MLNIATIKAQVDLFDLVSASTELHGGPREFSGPCPRCSGNDRFHLNKDRGWFCRHCTGEPGGGGHWHDQIDFIMFLTDCDFITAYKKLGGGDPITAEESTRIRAERVRRDATRRQQEAAAQSARRLELDASGAALAYWRNLDALDKRDSWRKRGLGDTWQDYFKVGYCPARTFMHDGHPFESATLTIPTWRPTIQPDTEPSITWQCINLAHRLLLPDAPGGKYRPHISGTGKALLNCDIYAPTIEGPILLVEGEIKAMVTYAAIQDYVYEVNQAHDRSYLGALSVIGIAGKSFKPEWSAELEQASRIWICLDPDATDAAQRIAAMLGAYRCRVILLPDKIDDMLNGGTLTAEKLMESIMVAGGVM